MASKWGTETTVGRCRGLWLGFSNCVTLEDDMVKCIASRDDYLECLHGKKQTIRINTMYLERQRRIKEGLPVPTGLMEDIASGKLSTRLDL
ncbi:hypothetical protein T492DRAFT_928824 [Pavlovales sp. CCMP2436]|nr:hypothetical protein T492DRAFT_928824 [Pavlovales sp. CCMP2436]|mmetsp:Transcript_6474/g.16856  ORF Transcript_6474/g.16856 Transcript_6474/m.16856 type:complete len:91 (-) Transcript_6474:255-527(-)